MPFEFSIVNALLSTSFGYLLGSLSAAIITCKLMSLPDPRSTGSNNPGTTNVLRLGGKKAAAITLFGDMLKGLLPVLVLQLLSDNSLLISLAGIGAFFGHLFPVFFGFKGGKGVATALGVLIGTAWIVGLLAIGTWLAIALTFRISSAAALFTFTVTPFYLWLATGDLTFVLGSLSISIFLFWRHKDNIIKLSQGKENKIGQ